MNVMSGTPGSAVVAGYCAAIVLVTLLALAHRRRLFRGAPTDVGRLGPEELAELAAPGRAVYVCLGTLHASGALDGPAPDTATDLERAVHDASRAGLGAPEMMGDEKVVHALHRIRDLLVRRGFAAGPTAVRIARRWVWPLAVLTVLGAMRAGFGGGPVLLWVAVACGVAATFWVGGRRVWATRRTQIGLRVLRSVNYQLAPERSPVYSTSGLALGIALFGEGALHHGAPALH